MRNYFDPLSESVHGVDGRSVRPSHELDGSSSKIRPFVHLNMIILIYRLIPFMRWFGDGLNFGALSTWSCERMYGFMYGFMVLCRSIKNRIIQRLIKQRSSITYCDWLQLWAVWKFEPYRNCQICLIPEYSIYNARFAHIWSVNNLSQKWSSPYGHWSRWLLPLR